MLLTAKQEAFAQAVASGMTLSDAYRSAYSAERMKPSTVNRKAVELTENGKITARLESLRAELAEKGLWSREDSLKALIGVVNNPERNSDIISAVKEINAMQGFNAPVKTELSGNMAVTKIERIIVRPNATN